nr:hypothetical protein [Tanacetum cinerariifolium]
MSWYSRCSWCGGPFNGGKCRHCTKVSSGDEQVYDSNTNSYNQTPDFSYPPSQPQTYSFDQFHCFRCGDPLEEGVRCQWCICKWCRYGLREGFYLFCASRDENSSIDVPNPNSFNDPLNVANLSNHTPEPSRHFNFIYDDDDDYKESTIPLNEIDSQIPPSIAITPVLPTMEPEDSLITEDEDLNTIHEKKSDEVIKSSVEDLVPIPNDDFTFSDDESLSDEDVPKDNVKIYSNPLFKFDDECISGDVNPLFDEVLEDKDSYVSNLDEPDFLVTPLSNANEDECFDPGDDVDEIELLLHHDPSNPKTSVASILEGFTNKPPLEENDDLFDLESKKNE